MVDREGVGRLVELGIKLGRTTRPKLKVGICGEHRGEPSSVELCHLVGVDDGASRRSAYHAVAWPP